MFQYLKWSELLPIQFFRRAHSEEIRCVEPNQITRSKLDRFVFAIIIASLNVLSSFDIFDKVIMDVVEMKGEIVHSGYRSRREFSEEARMEAIVGEEWGHSSGFLTCIVVCKFSKREQVEPVILFLINKDVEVRFQSLIHSFGLTIGLGMECGRLARINLKNRSEHRPKVRRKNRTTIGDDGIGKSM